MKYQHKAEYQDHLESLLEKCNNDGAQGCIWVVRIKIGFNDGQPEVTARIAFESHNDYVFTKDKFIKWWQDTYMEYNSPYDDTWVEIFTNYTPTEICVPKLKYWLCKNQNVTRLTIHFAFVYTWNRKDRKVPKSEYVRRLQNLANFSDSSVRIKKINAYVLSRLARQARVYFPGYQKRWNPNDSLEQAIITHY